MRFFFILILFICSPSIANADEFVEHTGRLELVLTNIPTFENYAVPISDDVKIAQDVDFSSHEEAWNYRTRLRRGLKNGPNFADKYVVVTHGCGTSCQVNWILNAETGRVLGRFSSTYGVDYRRDSWLIIRNQPDYSLVEPEYYNLMSVVDYYRIWMDELRLIKRIHMRSIYPDIDSISSQESYSE